MCILILFVQKAIHKPPWGLYFVIIQKYLQFMGLSNN